MRPSPIPEILFLEAAKLPNPELLDFTLACARELADRGLALPSVSGPIAEVAKPVAPEAPAASYASIVPPGWRPTRLERSVRRLRWLWDEWAGPLAFVAGAVWAFREALPFVLSLLKEGRL